MSVGFNRFVEFWSNESGPIIDPKASRNLKRKSQTPTTADAATRDSKISVNGSSAAAESNAQTQMRSESMPSSKNMADQNEPNSAASTSTPAAQQTMRSAASSSSPEVSAEQHIANDSDSVDGEKKEDKRQAVQAAKVVVANIEENVANIARTVDAADAADEADATDTTNYADKETEEVAKRAIDVNEGDGSQEANAGGENETVNTAEINLIASDGSSSTTAKQCARQRPDQMENTSSAASKAQLHSDEQTIDDVWHLQFDFPSAALGVHLIGGKPTATNADGNAVEPPEGQPAFVDCNCPLASCTTYYSLFQC